MSAASPASSVLLGLLALLASCAEEPSASAHVERLVLGSTTGVEASQQSRTVTSLLPKGEEHRAHMLAPESSVAAIDANGHGEMRDAWELRGAGSKRLEIQGPFDPASFNRVRVHAMPGAIETVRVTLSRKNGKEIGTQGVRMGGAISAYWHDFDLEGIRKETAEFNRLVLRYDGPSERVCILQVQLVSVPWSSMLPDAKNGPGLVRIGEDSRRAVGLVAGTPLSADFEAHRGAVLALSIGQPDVVRSKRPGVRVVVKIEGGSGKTLEQALALPPPRAQAAWTEVAIPLADRAGARLHATFTLEGAEDEVVALGEPLLRIGDPRERAPTVLLVTSDTHRGDHVGLATNGVGVRTPFLDSLAERGIFFEDCWSSTNVTRPSHVALLTSVPPRDTGIVTNFQRLTEEAPTLAEAFRSAGYATFAAVSAAPLDDRFSGLGQGFDRMSSPDEPQRDAAATIERLLAWLPSAEGVPLFVWLHLFDAHAPYVVPEEYRRLYYPADRDPYDAALPELDEQARPSWDPAVRDPAWELAQYKSQVSYLDDRLAALFARSRFSEGIVAVTGDHGESLDAHGIYYSHAELYPDTLHVPLILAWPGASGGERVSSAVRQIDIGRTLLDLAGLEASAFPGRDLLRGPAPDTEEPRFALSSQATSASVQAGRWFLVLHLEEGTMENGLPRKLHAIELYDLSTDRRCLDEASARHPEETARLRAVLVDWLLAARAKRWQDAGSNPSVEEVERMGELGYAEGDKAPRSSAWFDADCACEECRPYAKR
jgi:arylsulfatase A-like enzyme